MKQKTIDIAPHTAELFARCVSALKPLFWQHDTQKEFPRWPCYNYQGQRCGGVFGEYKRKSRRRWHTK